MIALLGGQSFSAQVSRKFGFSEIAITGFGPQAKITLNPALHNAVRLR
jgi:hypothetical protein